MRFESPLFFLLLLALPPLFYLRLRKLRQPALRFSSIAPARRLRPSWRHTLRDLPLALRAAALVLVAVALARPRIGIDEIRDAREGIAIEIVIDRSGSMAAEIEYADQRLNRLEVVKLVVAEFVSGRPNDLIGMVSFARYADTICPLTLAHGAATGFLKTIRLVQRESEDGTAIGDAIALAAARLETAGSQARESYEVTSKVIVLLTDGIYNAGSRTPVEAARLAAEWGIRVHTIGIGGGGAYTTINTPLRTVRIPTAAQIDRDTLKRIANITGGIYRDVVDVESLRQVYDEIDRLEKSDIEYVKYADYREVFLPFALAALLLLLCEVALGSTLLRRVP